MTKAEQVPVNRLAAAGVAPGGGRRKRRPGMPSIRDFPEVVLQMEASALEEDVADALAEATPLLAGCGRVGTGQARAARPAKAAWGET